MSPGDATNVPATSDTVSAAEIPHYVDRLIALHLNMWPALSLAIQNGWGTSSPQIGEDKRAWLAGAIGDLFAQNQLRDIEDLEDVLEQVMSDEFEVVIDDGSLEEVANRIWKDRQQILLGDGSEVQRLQLAWEKKKAKGEDKIVGIAQRTSDDSNNETDDDDDEEEEEWNGFNDGKPTVVDVEMDEAPALVDSSNTKSRPKPEVDEDGFTKVVGRKKR